MQAKTRNRKPNGGKEADAGRGVPRWCVTRESQGHRAEQRPLSSPGEENESQAGGKGTLLLRARGGMKVTKNRGGNGNK